jgi:hypothetical protein
MGPEEFYYMEYLRGLNNEDLREIRISSLKWVLDGYTKGTIRRGTIVSLIPYTSLVDLLTELESDERYEDCEVVWKLMETLYNENEKSNDECTSPFTNRGMEDWG